MKTIEIVVHCYAEKIPDFAAMLTAQLSSLVLWTPKTCNVTLRVCAKSGDQLTDEAGFGFGPFLAENVFSDPLWLDGTDIFRRAIGRNIAAKRSNADIVWFADADYLFGEGCLDALAASDFKGLAYPRDIMIHKSHAVGDAELARIKIGEQFEPDLTLFKPQRIKFAIGGLQIVDGDTARAGGYLDGTRWVKPTTATDFQDTREDRVFRGLFPKSTALELPNLFRMRHSRSAFESADSRLKQTS